MLEVVKLWRSLLRFHNRMGKLATPAIIPYLIRTRAVLNHTTPPIRLDRDRII
jgi:hypothetical protein